ncbi:uncharacterized protein G2W53_044695 [Senna tora]|uniref:DUF8003 domain-containing protein n=1 Tax=Senna tora TaxID=362788 RepID=A0A834VXQ2_9FABA|nr:uncharacterized protein G2W53_044695 [Senna tora]
MSDSELQENQYNADLNASCIWSSTHVCKNVLDVELEMLIDGGGDVTVATSLLEASNLIVLKVPLDYFVFVFLCLIVLGSQWLSHFLVLLSHFGYRHMMGPGSILRGPLENATTDDVTPKLNCDSKDCPSELLHPPEDCNVNSSLSFTLQWNGNDSSVGTTAGGGIIVIGSIEHPLSSLFIQGSVRADGDSFEGAIRRDKLALFDSSGGPGGGYGGTILLFLHTLTMGESAILLPIASVNGSIHTGGGKGRGQGGSGENGTITGKACPKGLYGTFCEECPAGTYKNVTGSDRSLCRHCPVNELPPSCCLYFSARYHMPHCYTALEELIYTFGGLVVRSLLMAQLPTQHGSQIDHSFSFLESLNEVLETNRVEESQSHVHRMYFMGPNTFSEPWHLPHTPPEQIQEIVYEGAFSTFVDEINAIAAYQWWEGAVYSILSVLAYPLAWSWQQWRRRLNLQRLREFVRSEYDHALPSFLSFTSTI